MEDVLYYLLKVAIATTVFYFTYHLLFRRSKDFVFNRFYLLGSFLLSFIIPLISVKTSSYLSQVSVYVSDNIESAGISEPVGYATGAGNPIGLSEVLLAIYLAGLVYYLVKMLVGTELPRSLEKVVEKKLSME